MPFTNEEAEEIKKQVLEQVEKLPNQNKEEIKSYIKGMNSEQLEEFLKKNKIQVTDKGLEQEDSDEEKSDARPQECIFCQIAKGKIPSYKIAKNDRSIGILEINPLSKGHSIILPLEHKPIEKMPKTSMGLAQKVAKRIKKKLKPEDIKIETTNFQGHSMINIIPMYKDIPLKKIQAEEEDLKKIQKKLETKTRQPRKKEKKVIEDKSKDEDKDSKLPRVYFRIP